MPKVSGRKIEVIMAKVEELNEIRPIESKNTTQIGLPNNWVLMAQS